MNEVKIFYNNKDIFSGIGPTPFVGISQDFIDFGTKWNQVTNISLNGQITGQYLGPSSNSYLNSNVNSLLNNLKENYKSLQIKEGSGIVYEADTAIITSLDIEDSSWYGVLPFTINFSIYDENLFTDYYGIVEPKDFFEFSEQEGDILNLKRTISAKGIKTQNNNAIENAKNWVLSKINDTTSIKPVLVKDVSAKNFIQTSSKETIDRFNGTYSWEADYQKSINPESPNNSILDYTLDLSSGINDGFLNVSINGSLKGNSISGLRQDFNNLNLFNICNEAAQKVFSGSITSKPINLSVDESENQNLLNFSAAFDNDFESSLNDVINNYNVDISLDALKCITTVNLRATLTSKYGDKSERWNKVQNFYKTKFFPYILANEEYKKEIPDKILNQNPISESIVFDEYNAQITYSSQFTDKRIAFNQNILSIASTVNLNPSINIYTPHTAAFIARAHNIQNLNCATRASLKITVNAIAKINSTIALAEQEARKEINRIKSNYISGSNILLEDTSISKDDQIKSITINETWTFDGAVIN